jgi:hypothetical protein
MAMVLESSTQEVRVVVKHTFLELVEDDEFGSYSVRNARQRSSSEPRKFSDFMLHLDTCEVERKSVASTRAYDTDDETELTLSDDEEPTLPVQARWSDDEEPTLPVQAPPPGVWAQSQPQQFMPVCVAVVPVMQQPVWKKSSRSARRRRARAMNRWYRHNMQGEGEQQEGAFEDDLDTEFDDVWQFTINDAESPEVDAESWPMPNSPLEVHHDKKKA